MREAVLFLLQQFAKTTADPAAFAQANVLLAKLEAEGQAKPAAPAEDKLPGDDASRPE